MSSTSEPNKRALPWLWIAVGALVVLAGAIAVVSAGGSDKEVTVGTVSDDGASSTAGEVQPITVEGASLPPLARDVADSAVGTVAPVLSGFGFDGTPMTIDVSKGPVMLIYLAHWCPHCNAEVPRLLEWKASGAVPADLQVIGVATAVSADRANYPPSEWLAGEGWDWPVLADSADSDAALAYGVSSLPFLTIIGEDGLVKGRSAGELGQDGVDAFTRFVTAALD